jgi:hypothetical protein
MKNIALVELDYIISSLVGEQRRALLDWRETYVHTYGIMVSHRHDVPEYIANDLKNKARENLGVEAVKNNAVETNTTDAFGMGTQVTNFYISVLGEKPQEKKENK